MPKYLQYKGQEGYWEWSDDSMTAYNVHGGHHEINENSPSFVEGTIVQAESWRDLWKKTGWNPLSTNSLEREMWIAPDGTLYGCGSWGAHEATAQDILRVIYNENEDFFDSGDKLIARGWIKVTACFVMYQYYEEAGYYDNMTDEQWEVHRKWKEKYL
jgi:hypothetical protein